MSRRSIISSLAVSALLSTGALASLDVCSANGPISCQSSASPSCCFNSPGGTLLQTQFWDTNPVTGPSNSWTIHGLWPDNCDGSYQSDCDPSRAYTDITGILQDQGRTQLLSYMSEYWVSNDESSEAFWEHEWATHGTCVNTIDPSCYTDYQPKEEVGDYFQKAVDLFQSRDTYTALSNAGITPDPSNTYALSDVQNALAAIHDGHVPTVLCSSGAISQVYYFFNVEGNAIDGTYYSVDALSSSNCPSYVNYYPKN